MANGRGAWNTAGVGGTRKYKDETKPGPYYYIGTGKAPSGRRRTSDEYAVYLAVMAYQRLINRKMKAGIVVDGWFGKQTSEVVFKFQEKYQDEVGTPWGGIGPETSEFLLRPLLNSRVELHGDDRVTNKMVSGTVRHESLWDAGAVGYLDPDDLGLAQINGKAHPDMTKVQRLTPSFAFDFICDYYTSALNRLDGNQRDAVAAYNLGVGGANSWIRAGRPDMWTPAGASRPRDVKGYIDSILAG